MGLRFSTTPSGGVGPVLQGAIGVVEWRQIDSMPGGDGLNLLNPLLSNESPSLGEGLEPALQGKSHTLQQTSMDNIGEGMPV
jgi:hypothetical protein